MHSPLYRRKPRLSGIASLCHVALGALPGGTMAPKLPTSARLRRDIGLPEIEEAPAPAAIPHRRF